MKLTERKISDKRRHLSVDKFNLEIDKMVDDGDGQVKGHVTTSHVTRELDHVTTSIPKVKTLNESNASMNESDDSKCSKFSKFSKCQNILFQSSVKTRSTKAEPLSPDQTPELERVLSKIKSSKSVNPEVHDNDNHDKDVTESKTVKDINNMSKVKVIKDKFKKMNLNSLKSPKPALRDLNRSSSKKKLKKRINIRNQTPKKSVVVSNLPNKSSQKKISDYWEQICKGGGGGGDR